MVLKHTTTDGKTQHEVDLHEKTHVVTVEELDGETVTNKRWGTQQKFVEKLISKEIEKIQDKIKVQKRTIGECHYYNKLEGIEITEKLMEKNITKLRYLEEYVY